MNCSGLYRYQRRSRDLEEKTKDDMRQRDQGTIARRRQHEEYPETQGTGRRCDGWITESLLRGYGQVSGEDTSSDNDRMDYRHERRDTMPYWTADNLGRYHW